MAVASDLTKYLLYQSLLSLDEQLRHCSIIFQAETETKHIDISVTGDDAEY